MIAICMVNLLVSIPTKHLPQNLNHSFQQTLYSTVNSEQKHHSKRCCSLHFTRANHTTSLKMSDSGNISPSPHIALLPSSGMGHLTPFIRLAATLIHHNCKVTFITTHPIVSLSEQNLLSKFLSNFPQIISKQFHLLPFNPEDFNSKDPFFLHFESIRRSAHLLSPLLTSSSSPPLSALITDITLASAILPITTELHIPNYILFTSSAKMLSFCAHFPKLADSSFQNTDSIQIPGSLSPIPKSWIPPLLLNPTNLFTTQFIENGQRLIESNGILINTFESLEPETLEALNNIGVLSNGFPPVIPIGPLVPCKFEQGSPLTWLDGEADGSVVYVSFGSRTAMSRGQIRELGDGLVRSGCRFVWVVKDKKVDREDEEGLEEVMGIELMERMKERGLVVKNWVDQEMILSHKSVDGFVSHCGWNSVTESAWHGVRMLAWPQGGDQRINGDVVEKSGFGMWVKSWGWGNEEEVVKGEEIGEKIREMMSDEELKMRAMHVREEARRGNEVGGSSKKWLLKVIEMWNTSNF